SADIKALGVIDSILREEAQGTGGFHVLRHGFQACGLRDLADHPHQSMIDAAARQLSNERAIDLQIVDRQAFQVAERAIPCAEIVYCDSAAEIAQHSDLLVGFHREAHSQLFGYLETNLISGNSVLFQ